MPPARNLPQRIRPEWAAPLAEGRLMLLSPLDVGVKRGMKETAVYRNCLVAALAASVLVAYAHPGSRTAAVARAAVGRGKPVYTLDLVGNAGLLGMGVRP